MFTVKSAAKLAAWLPIVLVPALILGCSHSVAEPTGTGAGSGAGSGTSGAASSDTASPPSGAAVTGNSICAELDALPVRDKLAQLLMVGVRDAADARAVVTGQHVGGIFVGSWTDLSMLTDGSLKAISAESGPLPLSVSVDEEGGRVSRLSSLIGPAPSARELARTQTPDQVRGLARQRGQQMRDLGITIDLTPVVDVVDDSTADNTVIGDRSFGSDPAKVTEYAGAYAQGLREAGLLPVLKHFPGHGHGSGDSHTGGVATPELQSLIDNDLVPYRNLVAQGPVAVMLGHLEVPGLTGDQPASLSPAAVALLRNGSGYQAPPFGGVVFSDDLSSMAAISDRYGVAEAVLRSLQAGVDVALWVSTDEVPAVLDRLETAVAGGEFRTLDAALARVSAAKGVHCGG